MTKLNIYLTFSGQCEAAFTFYEKHLGGKISMMMKYDDSPSAAQTPPDWREKVFHSTLVMGEQILQGVDLRAEQYVKPQGFFVSLNFDDTTEAERVFTALTEMGVVIMPLERTFWAERFGMLIDRFGTPWMINCGMAT